MALLMKLSHNGLKGYLGRGKDEWACLVEKERAARLTTRVYQGNLFYGTEDGWWLSVGSQGGRNGYVGFYWWGEAAGVAQLRQRANVFDRPVRRLHLLLGRGWLRCR